MIILAANTLGTIVATVIAFLVLTLLLVALLLFVKQKLSPSGPVKIKINGENATTIPVEVKLMSYFLRRMVRKGTNYVEDSFSTKCKDAQIRIKPFLITRRKVSRAVRKALRNKAREWLTEEIKGKSCESVFEEILRNQLQKSLSLKLKKIYPLSLCEIRIFKVEDKKE